MKHEIIYNGKVIDVAESYEEAKQKIEMYADPSLFDKSEFIIKPIKNN